MKLKKILFVLLFDVLLLAGCCFIYAYVNQKFSPPKWSYLLVGVLLFLLIGFVNGILVGKKGFFVGLISGSAICLLLTLILVLGMGETVSVIKIIIYIISSTLGGTLGRNLRK